MRYEISFFEKNIDQPEGGQWVDIDETDDIDEAYDKIYEYEKAFKDDKVDELGNYPDSVCIYDTEKEETEYMIELPNVYDR